MRPNSNDSCPIEVLAPGQNVTDVIYEKIDNFRAEMVEEAFYVADLGDVVKKYERWVDQLPRVKPFYAVKCNEDPYLLQTLINLGTGFDCASKGEIKLMLELGVSPERIIYANPCKQKSHIKYAQQSDVQMMTFDNETELYKVKDLYPDAKLVIRILPPENQKVQCQLGNKFGCHLSHVKGLLEKARELELNVVGVSFHVGSGCYDATAFSTAVALARTTFDIGKNVGFDFNLLDIGGGFPGHHGEKITFEEICGELRPALETFFPEDSGVHIIAEPGRYFASSAFSLVVNVIAKRTVTNAADCENSKSASNIPTYDNALPNYMYYVNDGVYGSFNCLLYDHAEVDPIPAESDPELPLYPSSIWGPTCDGLDVISKSCYLPELGVGSWVIFHNMGAYTLSAGCTFNGMPRPQRTYVVSQDYRDLTRFITKQDDDEQDPIKFEPFWLPLKMNMDQPAEILHEGNTKIQAIVVM